MAKIIQNERSPFIEKAAEIQAQNRVGQFSKFLESNPLFVTYYSINRQLSMTDSGFGDVEEFLGPTSPIRFNEIKEFPIYGINDLIPDIENDEQKGLDLTLDVSGLIILPNTIKPQADDFFYLKLPGMPTGCLFHVTDYKHTSFNSNDFYTIDGTLDHVFNQSNSEKKYRQLQAQVVERYTCIFDNIGTEDKCLVKSDDIAESNALSEIANTLRDSFTETYFDSELGVFAYRDYSLGYDSCSYYYDLYLIEFLKETRMFDAVTEDWCLAINYDDILPVNFKNLYKRSIFYAVQHKDTSFLERYPYYTLSGIMKMVSPFVINRVSAYSVQLRYEHAPMVAHASSFKTGVIAEHFPIELTNAIIDSSSIEMQTYMDQLIYDYLNGISISFDKDKFLQEDLRPSIRNYKYIPIIVYILNSIQEQIFKSN